MVMDAVSTIAGSVPEGSALALATRASRRRNRLRADGRLVEVGVEEPSRWAAPGHHWFYAPACAPRRSRPPSSPMRPRMAGRALPRRAVPAGTAALDGAPDPVHRRRSVRRRLRSLRGTRAAVPRSASSPARRSWIASTGPSATPSWNAPALYPRVDRADRTCSWCRSIGQREKYRYHNLFRDVLRAELGANPERSRSCIGAPRTGSRKRACSRRRSCMRTRAEMKTARRSSSSAWAWRTTARAHRHPPPMARPAR